MTNPLAMKLEQYTPLDQGERSRLDALTGHGRRVFEPGEVIFAEGQHVREIILVMDGFAARAKSLRDGGRQIMAFLIPGDLCDVEIFVLHGMDHDVIALDRTTCAIIPKADMEALLSEVSTLTKALWWSTMTDSAVLRSRIVGQGRRDARERMAHLVYEMLIRYRVTGRAPDNVFPLPLTQTDLADATGVTPVHANRTLQQLRAEGLIEFERGVLRVLDAPALKQAAKFESNYLHLDRTERDTDISTRVGGLI